MPTIIAELFGWGELLWPPAYITDPADAVEKLQRHIEEEMHNVRDN